MGFFATFWSWLNGQLGTYIGNNTARLAAALQPAVVTMAVIYVMAWGYLHLTGQIEEPFVAGLKRIMTVAVILGVGLNLWLYNTVIVDTFYNAPCAAGGRGCGCTGSHSDRRCDMEQRRHGRRESLEQRKQLVQP